jgi:hypothetical protein
MNVYAEIHGETKRQALGRLSDGSGVQAPNRLVELPTGESRRLVTGRPRFLKTAGEA